VVIMPRAQSVTVVSKERAASGVTLLAMTAADRSRLPDWTPGAHVDLILPNGMIRQYSLCGDRWDSTKFQIAVLREVAGRGGSAYIHDQLAVGDTVGIAGLRNSFPLVPAERYRFIAGGIGITPLLPMLHQAELTGAEWSLLYVGRSRQSMAFLSNLARYEGRVCLVPKDEQRQLDVAEWLGAAQKETKVYCCGPVSLITAVERACAQWPAHALRTERFMTGALPRATRATPFEVVLARTGRMVTVQPGASVLDALREARVSVMSSCQQGLCGTCETTVIAGLPDHRDSVLSDVDREAGDCMMICVSGSRGDRLILDL
jgi:ferredoxin-NADP reductase